MVWMERDLEAQKAVLHEIDSRLCDDESRLFGVLFSALTSKQYRRKYSILGASRQEARHEQNTRMDY